MSGLSSLKSLNLDARQITDAGLAALTSKTLSIVSVSSALQEFSLKKQWQASGRNCILNDWRSGGPMLYCNSEQQYIDFLTSVYLVY